MEYMKYHMHNYRVHIMKTNKFKTITVKINFKRKINKEEITIRKFLSYMLLNSTEKYKTERQLNIKIEDLYNIGIGSNTRRSGKYDILSVTINFLNEHYTEKGMNKESLDFLNEIIFHPNINNKAFDNEAFLYIKKIIKEEIESFKDNPNSYSIKRLYQETDPNGIISYIYNGYLDDLEKITPEMLYDYYISVINNDILDIFIIGDIDEEKIKEKINKMIPINNRNQSNETHMLTLPHDKKEIKIVKEKSEFNQSKLAISLRLGRMNKFENEYVLQVFSYIFGGGSESKLFKKVREENSLCYYINANSNMLDRYMIIKSGIDSKEFDKVISLIKECLNDMKNGNFTEEDIEKSKIIYVNGCKEIMDSPGSIINNYISKEYLNLDLLEDKIKNIQKVSKKSVIELSEKIEIDTIYLLEGGNYENNSFE